MKTNQINVDKAYLSTVEDDKIKIFPIDNNMKQAGEPIQFVGNYNVRGQG